MRKPIPGFDGVFSEPEQQPEAPLGIENAVSGAKESFRSEHSGHGRLYRPQATLARPPASGNPYYSLSSLSITIVSRRVLATLGGHYKGLYLLAMPPDSCYLVLSNTRKAKLLDLMLLPASA